MSTSSTESSTTRSSTARGTNTAVPPPAGELADRVKAVHRGYPTGVTIVTSAVDGQPFGLAVNAFSSLSMEPPTVLVCVNATSASHPGFFQQDTMAVNILASDQAAVAADFGRSNPDKFRSHHWHLGYHGAPLLNGVAASFELAVETRVQAYTHTIFIGRVLEATHHDRLPLIYLDRRFFDSADLPGVIPPARSDRSTP